jgi:hypothetical protein
LILAAYAPRIAIWMTGIDRKEPLLELGSCVCTELVVEDFAIDDDDCVRRPRHAIGSFIELLLERFHCGRQEEPRWHSGAYNLLNMRETDFFEYF